MTGYDFYRIYISLKLHFSSSYDVFKYGFKNRATTKEIFETRKDKKLFDIISNKFSSSKTCGQFCLANFVYNEGDWLYNQSYSEMNDIYLKWKARISSLTKILSNDNLQINKILQEKRLDNENDLVKITRTGNKPPLLQLLLAGYVSKEYVALYPNSNMILKSWQDAYEVDPFISDLIFTLRKYKPFLEQYYHGLSRKKS